MEPILMSAVTPLVAGFIYLLVAGIFELKTYKVPNILTFASIGLALLFAFVAGQIAPERNGSIVSAFVGMLLGGALLLPFYAKGVLGAGCVKAQAAFGAWIGAGFATGASLKFVLVSTIMAAIIGLICFGLTYAKRKQEAQPNPYAYPPEPEAYFMKLMHGQLPLSIGTMIGMVFACII